jgi:excisionase family DNA binding protein
VKDHFENIYGPIGPGQQPVLREVIVQLRRIAERLDGGSVSPAALDRVAAAKYLGVELKTLDYLVRRRKIRYVQVGDQRGRVFRITDLNDFLSENLEETAEEILQKRTRK